MALEICRRECFWNPQDLSFPLTGRHEEGRPWVSPRCPPPSPHPPLSMRRIVYVKGFIPLQGCVEKKQGSLPQSHSQQDDSTAIIGGLITQDSMPREVIGESGLWPPAQACPRVAGQSLLPWGPRTSGKGSRGLRGLDVDSALPPADVLCGPTMVPTSLGLNFPHVGSCWSGQCPTSPSQICQPERVVL